jgi:hypothetical protein
VFAAPGNEGLGEIAQGSLPRVAGANVDTQRCFTISIISEETANGRSASQFMIGAVKRLLDFARCAKSVPDSRRPLVPLHLLVSSDFLRSKVRLFNHLVKT